MKKFIRLYYYAALSLLLFSCTESVKIDVLINWGLSKAAGDASVVMAMTPLYDIYDAEFAKLGYESTGISHALVHRAQSSNQQDIEVAKATAEKADKAAVAAGYIAVKDKSDAELVMSVYVSSAGSESEEVAYYCYNVN